jgi:hypothetical protein
MGRIEKQKRLIIKQANKRVLGESPIDMGVVLELIKYKFPNINVTDERIEEFENWAYKVKEEMSSQEYADLLHDYMIDPSRLNNNYIAGDIGDLEIDIDNDGDPEHFDIIKKGRDI